MGMWPATTLQPTWLVAMLLDVDTPLPEETRLMKRLPAEERRRPHFPAFEQSTRVQSCASAVNRDARLVVVHYHYPYQPPHQASKSLGPE